MTPTPILTICVLAGEECRRQGTIDVAAISQDDRISSSVEILSVAEVQREFSASPMSGPATPGAHERGEACGSSAFPVLDALVERARGKFVWFVRAGDVLPRTALPRMLDALDRLQDAAGLVVNVAIEDQRDRASVEKSLEGDCYKAGAHELMTEIACDRFERYEQALQFVRCIPRTPSPSGAIVLRTEWLEARPTYLSAAGDKLRDLRWDMAVDHMLTCQRVLTGRCVDVIRHPVAVTFDSDSAPGGASTANLLWPFIRCVHSWGCGANPLHSEGFIRLALKATRISAPGTCLGDEEARGREAWLFLITHFSDYPALWRKLIGPARNISLARILATASCLFRLVGKKPFRQRIWKHFTGRTGNPSQASRVPAPALTTTRYLRARAAEDAAATAYFTGSVQGAEHCRLMHPVYLKHPECVSVGRNLSSGPGLRIEAWRYHHSAPHDPRVTIGANVSINFNVHIACSNAVTIGDFALIGSNVLITDHQHGDVSDLDFTTYFARQPLYSRGEVRIGSNVWIGENVSIMPNVEIGADSIVAANAVVTTSFPAFSLIGGVPARLIRSLRP